MQFQLIDLELLNTTGNCAKCGQALVGTSIMVDHVNDKGHWSKAAVHPVCYKPNQPMPIQLTKKMPSDIETVISEWNKEFDLEDYQEKFRVIEDPCIPLNLAWATQKRRCWLEIFKFLSPQEVAIGIATASREMYLYSWDTELWGASPGDLGSADVGRRRSCYILSQLKRCVSCGESRECRLLRCPILKKPLCLICRENASYKGDQKYSLKLVSSLLAKYGINRSVLDQLGVPITYDRKKRARAYVFMVEEAAKKYSQGRYGHPMTTRRKKRNS